jgi:hypothetical protein
VLGRVVSKQTKGNRMRKKQLFRGKSRDTGFGGGVEVVTDVRVEAVTRAVVQRYIRTQGLEVVTVDGGGLGR